MAKKKLGWRSEYSGKEYEDGSPELVGMGNPPNDPEFAKENVGQGHLPLIRTVIPSSSSSSSG